MHLPSEKKASVEAVKSLMAEERPSVVVKRRGDCTFKDSIIQHVGTGSLLALLQTPPLAHVGAKGDAIEEAAAIPWN